MTGSPAELTTGIIENLFAKFVAMYGTKLADQWAGANLEQVKSTWAQALSELSRPEIVDGIQRLIRSGKPFPPTLPEFYGYCRPPVTIPPVTDHRGLDALAHDLGVSSSNCPSYHSLREKIAEAIADRRQVPRLAVS